MKESFALLVFFLTYAGIILRRDKALHFVCGSVVLLLLAGVFKVQSIPSFINYNVLGIFLGTSALSFLFEFSGVPSLIVNTLSGKKHSTGVIFLLLCVATGTISILVDNVATILIMAPVAIEFSRAHRINPVPLIVGMAVSSNLQGCATMVGDSPSIILAMESGMNFNDFFYMPASKLSLASGRPGIFFFVQAGAAAGFAVLYLFFRKYKKVLKLKAERKRVKTFIPTVLIAMMIISLASASLLQNGFRYFPAAICLFYGAAGMAWFFVTERKEKFLVKQHISWDTFLLLIGLFILVGMLKELGFINDLAAFMERLGGKSPFVLYNIIVWFSVAVSSFVDNIPYTMALISGITLLADKLALNPFIYLFGLLLGTCIGGNITPIGASCNVVGVGILRKNGYRVSFKDFVKIGLPFTVFSVATSALLMWVVYR